MRKAFRHTGVLMMSAVVALGLLGAGFALWFQVLTLNASVHTGVLDVQWSAEGTNKTVSTDQGAHWGAPAAGKMNTVSCDENWPAGDNTQHTLNVSATNLFPYSGCEYLIDVHNSGTVPVHVDIPAAVTELSIAIGSNPLVASLSGCTGPTGSLQNNGQYQLHQGEELHCTIRISLLQAASEDTDYSFTTHIIARQYNEDYALLPGVTRVWSAALHYNGAGGWGGWSCPAGTHVVGGGVSGTSGTITPSIPMAVSMPWGPGATVGSTTYPNTPWGGYTYTPPESGWIAQDAGTAGTAYIYVDCAP